MRRHYALLGLLVVGVSSGPALALTAEGTMGEWSIATEADRDRVLDAIGPSLSPDFGAERPAVLACMGRAGQRGSHDALLILEIARACVAIVEHRAPDDAQDQQI